MLDTLDRLTLLDAAGKIADEIVSTAVWSGDRCSWVGAMPEDTPDGRIAMTYQALGADLYGGTAGVGLFLAELAVATGNGDARRTALGALRHAISRVDSLPQMSPSGLYTGRIGVALALVLADRALCEGELTQVGADLARREDAHRGNGREFDLMSGEAGAIVGLLALAGLLDDASLIERALGHADALLAGAESGARGLCWRSPSLPGAPGLTGLSHGAAGIGVALLELAAATGIERYGSAASLAFAYERTLYDPRVRNWQDLRDIAQPHPGGAVFATFWCHGAPGIALARMRAIELGASDQLRDEALIALGTTDQWVDAALRSGAVNYSTCHGLAGNAEILLEGSVLAASDLPHRVAASGIESYIERNAPWPTGAHGGATPSLFLGLAGIGRFYLRLACRELPSLLLVRPILKT